MKKIIVFAGFYLLGALGLGIWADDVANPYVEKTPGQTSPDDYQHKVYISISDGGKATAADMAQFGNCGVIVRLKISLVPDTGRNSDPDNGPILDGTVMLSAIGGAQIYRASDYSEVDGHDVSEDLVNDDGTSAGPVTYLVVQNNPEADSDMTADYEVTDSNAMGDELSAKATVPLPGSPTPPDPSTTTHDEVAGPKYRKIALNGRPLADEKPQQKGETDEEPEESYIDALTLRLNHSTTDVYVPLPGGELSLSVRRNTEAEIFNFRSGYLPQEQHDLPFGSNWSSNITPHIDFSIHSGAGKVTLDPNTVDITDENGASYRFIRFDFKDSQGNSTFKFFPLPMNRYEQDSLLSSLTQTASDTYVLKRKFGTTLIYKLSSITDVISNNRLPEASSCQPSYSQTAHLFARLQSVQDRFGTQIRYTYNSPATLIPSTIAAYDAQGNALQSLGVQVSPDGFRVLSITDSRAQVHTYSYSTLSLTDGRYGTSATVLASVTAPPDASGQSGVTQYGYGTYVQADHSPGPRPNGPTPTLFVDLTSITDPNHSTYSFSYTENDSRIAFSTKYGGYIQDGLPRFITTVHLPNGSAAAFQNFSNYTLGFFNIPAFSGFRQVQVADATGNKRVYDFLNGSVYSSSAYDALFSSPTKHQFTISYSELRMSYLNAKGGLLGMETYDFEPRASNAVSKTTDFSGNVTQFHHDDPWDSSLNYGFMGANLPGYTGLYQEPTAQVNALGYTKQFTYAPESLYRIMTSMLEKDAVGNTQRITSYRLNSFGLRTEETISDGSGKAQQVTDFEYADARFPGFVTKKTLRSGLAGQFSPPGEQDRIMAYVADSKGRIQQEIEDPNGLHLVTQHTYDENNNGISTTDPNGHTTSFTYDNLNRLIAVTNPDGTQKTTTYDLRGNKIAEADENGHQTLYQYDTLNRLIQSTRVLASGNIVTKTAYNNVNSKIQETDARGHTTTMAYDELQRVTTTTDANGKTTKFTYGANAGGDTFDSSSFKPTHAVDRNGYATDVTYDALYRPISSSVQYAKSPVSAATTQKQYDIFGNVTQVIDPLLKVSTTTYDALNRPTVATLAVGTPDASTITTRYDSVGDKVEMIDPLGRVTDFQYDGAGRLAQTFQPLVDDGTGHPARPTTQSLYDNAGNVIATINPLNQRWDSTFDVRNRKVQELDPAVLDPVSGTLARPTMSMTYDAVGNVLTTTDPRGFVTTKLYDEANRVVQVTSPAVPIAGGKTASPVSKTGYDLTSNILTVTDPDGNVTTNTYDNLNRLVTTKDAVGITVTSSYDNEGNKTQVKDGLGHSTTFAYDGLKRNLQVTDPSGKSTSLTYDAMNKIARTDSLGQVTQYLYNNRYKLVQTIYVGRTQDNRLNSYDLADNLLAVSEPDPNKAGRNDVANVYDALNRVVQETSNHVAHTYKYDLAGNRLSTQYGNGGLLLVSSYDALNRLTILSESNGATSLRTSSYAYDLSGNIVLKVLANGEKTTKTYDALNRVQLIKDFTPANVVQYSYAQTYDLAGNVTQIVENTALGARTVATTYDKIYRLLTENVTGSGAYADSYAYDNANNRTKYTHNKVLTSYLYNPLNQLISTTGGLVASYTYSSTGRKFGGHFTIHFQNLPLHRCRHSCHSLSAYSLYDPF